MSKQRKCGDVDWLWTLLPWGVLTFCTGLLVDAVAEAEYGWAVYFGAIAAAAAWALVRTRGVARHCANEEHR